MSEGHVPYGASQGVVLEEDAASAAIRQRRATPADPPPSTTVRAWLALEKRRRALEAQLKTIVTNQDRARQRLLEEWSMAGINAERVDGLTVHLRRKLYPRVTNKAALAAALQEEGLAELLTVDEKAFAVYVTAMDEEGQALPASIQAHVPDQYERFDVAVRLSGGGSN